MTLSTTDKLTAGNAATVRHALALSAADSQWPSRWPQSELQAALSHAESVVPVTYSAKHQERRAAGEQARRDELGTPPLPDWAEGEESGRETRRAAWRKARAAHVDGIAEGNKADPDEAIWDALRKVGESTGQSFIVWGEKPRKSRLRAAWRALRGQA